MNGFDIGMSVEVVDGEPHVKVQPMNLEARVELAKRFPTFEDTAVHSVTFTMDGGLAVLQLALRAGLRLGGTCFNN